VAKTRGRGRVSILPKKRRNRKLRNQWYPEATGELASRLRSIRSIWLAKARTGVMAGKFDG
jgi:hypothetical protein